MLLCRSLPPPAGSGVTTYSARRGFPLWRIEADRKASAPTAPQPSSAERPPMDPPPHPQCPPGKRNVRARSGAITSPHYVTYLASIPHREIYQMRPPKPECLLHSVTCQEFRKLHEFMLRTFSARPHSPSSGEAPVYAPATRHVALPCRPIMRKYTKNRNNFLSAAGVVPSNKINNLGSNRGLGAKRSSPLKSVKRGLQYTIDRQPCRSRNVQLNQQDMKTVCAQNVQKQQFCVSVSVQISFGMNESPLGHARRERRGSALDQVSNSAGSGLAISGCRQPTAFCLPLTAYCGTGRRLGNSALRSGV